MWVKVNGWIKLPEGAEIHQERPSSKRAWQDWQDWSERGWWSADSGTTTQEGDRTTTQEGDRTAQQEPTTTQEDSDDGWIPQHKNKHQKMDYKEINARDSSSSWWDWQQHNEWPGWQQWQDSDNPQSSTGLHAWTESWPESIAQYTSMPEEEMEAVLDTATRAVENLQLASSSGPFAPDNSADLVLPAASSSGPSAPDNSADWVLPPNSGSIDPPISFEPSVSSALSEPQSQSVTSPGSGVHRKVPRSKKGPQFQKRRWKSRKQKH